MVWHLQNRGENTVGYKKALRCAAVIVCMTALAAFPAWGEELYQAVDGNQIPEEQLQDNVVEYEELGSLIHRGNQNVQEMIRNTERTEQNYQEIRDYLRTEKAGANRDKKEAKDDGDMEGYAEFSMLEEIYSSAAKSYNDMIKKLNSTSSNQNRLQLEKQLTSAAQSLMISYQSVELQLEYMKKMLEVYKTQYNIAMLQNTSGAAVETDVQTAYNRWKEMEISVEELDNSRKEIHQSLCRILGVDETAEVSEISVLDVDSIPEADLESDTVKAIGNYRDLIDERHTNPLDTASLNKKKRTVTELEETVKIQMKQLYEDISQAKQACRAAETGFDSAQIRWNNVQTQYAMGMLNQTQYLEEQAEYLQKKISYDGANLNLLQAVETYKWAVEGMITLD